MAKRTATTDINHENWDQEYEPEEAGSFQKAPEEELKRRVFKTAKRRNLTDQGGGKTSAFSAFAGFSKPQAPPTSSTFSFLSNATPKTNGNSSSTAPVVKMADKAEEKHPTLDEYYSKLKGLNESVANFIKSHVETNPLVNLLPVFYDYDRYLKDLDTLKNSLTDDVPYEQNPPPGIGRFNYPEPPARRSFSPERYASTPIPQTVREWMRVKYKQSSFPFGATDLTTKPSYDLIFGETTPAPSTLTPVETEKSTTKPSEGFSFGATAATPSTLTSNKPAESEKKTTKLSESFSFGATTATPSTLTSNKPVETKTLSEGFSFGATTATPSTLTSNKLVETKKLSEGFSFGATTATPFTLTSNKPVETEKLSKGFSFGATTAAPSTLTSIKPVETVKTGDDEDDSEPPKPEFTPVVEEGHIYTTRCKVFVKKDKTYTDRGVGNLFLKPVPSSEKVQLIVRADTSLGNLLCNFILSSSIPIQRLGKKDVNLVCIPTPDTKPPPVSILLRVKSEEEANLLFETLQKHKK